LNRAITINLNNDLVTKLRLIQADRIEKENQGISFSKIVNQTIKNHVEENNDTN